MPNSTAIFKTPSPAPEIPSVEVPASVEVKEEAKVEAPALVETPVKAVSLEILQGLKEKIVEIEKEEVAKAKETVSELIKDVAAKTLFEKSKELKQELVDAAKSEAVKASVAFSAERQALQDKIEAEKRRRWLLGYGKG